VNGVTAQHIQVINGDTVINQTDPALLSQLGTIRTKLGNMRTLMAQAQNNDRGVSSSRSQLVVVNGDTLMKIVNGDTLVYDPEAESTIQKLLQLNLDTQVKTGLLEEWMDQTKQDQN
jgi:hypothetical protein